MLIQIKCRFDARVLYECDADSMLDALQKGVKTGADLAGADLTRAYLAGADLTGADLTGADLTGAYLAGAYLAGADLAGADLTRADLTRAYLAGADLRGAKINWKSHALLGEILRRAAGDDVQRRCLAGGIAVSTDWCWDKMLSLDHPEKQWAMEELAKWVQHDDGAPEVIRELAAKGAKT